MRKMASWPSGKARVCKTLITGPNPVDASGLFTIDDCAARRFLFSINPPCIKRPEGFCLNPRDDASHQLFNPDKLTLARLQHAGVREGDVAAVERFAIETNTFLLDQSASLAFAGRQTGAE